MIIVHFFEITDVIHLAPFFWRRAPRRMTLKQSLAIFFWENYSDLTRVLSPQKVAFFLEGKFRDSAKISGKSRERWNSMNHLARYIIMSHSKIQLQNWWSRIQEMPLEQCSFHPGWYGYIEDEILPSYIGIIINHYPSLPNTSWEDVLDVFLRSKYLQPQGVWKPRVIRIPINQTGSNGMSMAIFFASEVF